MVSVVCCAGIVSSVAVNLYVQCDVCNHRLVILLRCTVFVVNSDCFNVLCVIIVDMCFD